MIVYLKVKLLLKPAKEINLGAHTKQNKTLQQEVCHLINFKLSSAYLIIESYNIKLVINGVYTDGQTYFDQFKIPVFIQALMDIFSKRSETPCKFIFYLFIYLLFILI